MKKYLVSVRQVIAVEVWAEDINGAIDGAIENSEWYSDCKLLIDDENDEETN